MVGGFALALSLAFVNMAPATAGGSSESRIAGWRMEPTVTVGEVAVVKVRVRPRASRRVVLQRRATGSDRWQAVAWGRSSDRGVARLTMPTTEPYDGRARVLVKTPSGPRRFVASKSRPFTVVAGLASLVEPAPELAPESPRESLPVKPAPSPTPEPEPEPTPDDRITLAWPVDAPLEITFAGDSITTGLYASTEEHGYRALVVKALEDAGGPVAWTRGGQVGGTVGTVSDTITFAPTTDLAVLALGTNDLWKTPPEEVREQYAALVAKVRMAASTAGLVCLGPWYNADAERLWGTPIREECERGGGRYLPMHDLYLMEANRGPAGVETFGGLSDDFHPNDAGYAAIAQRLLDALRIAS